MRLTDEQYEEIKQTVMETFQEYDIKCIPINAFEMAIKMGISVIPYSALSDEKQEVARRISIDGYSVETSDYEWIIYYNDSCKSYGRINQTIMHEIGHFVLGHTEECDQEEAEAEAKFFAKYALAPPPLIHNLKLEITVQSIMEVFDLSYQAANNAYGYYKMWLQYGECDYTEYELKILRLFEAA